MKAEHRQFYNAQGYVLNVPLHKKQEAQRRQEFVANRLELAQKRLRGTQGKNYRQELLFLAERKQLTTHSLLWLTDELITKIVHRFYEHD